MSLIICPECGHENQEDARYCDECGISLPLPVPAEAYSQAEEEFAPNNSEDISSQENIDHDLIPQSQESFEEETYQAPIAEESFEEETYQTPVAESQESFEEETYQTPIAEAEEMITPNEPEESFKETTPSVAPISSATILDWDEPELSPQPSTALEVIQAILIHPETGTRFELPTNEKLVYLGKINEEMPVQIDLSVLPDADIISRVHAVIHVEDKNYYLEDAGSLNGTALNGESVKPGARFRKQLSTGDTITLGRNKKVNLTFEIQE